MQRNVWLTRGYWKSSYSQTDQWGNMSCMTCSSCTQPKPQSDSLLRMSFYACKTCVLLSWEQWPATVWSTGTYVGDFDSCGWRELYLLPTINKEHIRRTCESSLVVPVMVGNKSCNWESGTYYLNSLSILLCKFMQKSSTVLWPFFRTTGAS